MSTKLRRAYKFSASHLYRRPEWNEERNRARFGKCALEPGHGHNYRLVVWVAGEIDPETGFIVDLAVLDGRIRDRVLEPLDHHHLNAAIAEFAPGKLIPTSENLVSWIRDRLVEPLPGGARIVGLSLAEDDDLAAEWSAE